MITLIHRCIVLLFKHRIEHMKDQELKLNYRLGFGISHNHFINLAKYGFYNNHHYNYGKLNTEGLRKSYENIQSCLPNLVQKLS